MAFKKGNIVKFKGKQSGNMRLLSMKGDKAVVEHVYKTDYSGKVIRTKPGHGVRQQVNVWELSKSGKK